MSKIRIMMIFGTRPEAIKLAPLILLAQKRADQFDTLVVVTAQHREMLDDVLSAFHIKPNMDLDIMLPGQTLFGLTSRIFAEMEKVMATYQPDVVVVQGDTTTTFAGAMSGYYAGKKIAYVEAGLRTGNKWAPFPEEIYRKAASTTADYLFAPTGETRQNLLKEGYDPGLIFVTGNTVIDSLLWMAEQVRDQPCPVKDLAPVLERFPRMVLITGHRRENFGAPFQNICLALKKLSQAHPDVCFVFPVHLNPHVQTSVRQNLEGLPNFFLLPPLPYPHFIWFMQKAHIIITDSGGIQEEAPALAKPVLVTRKVTERPEALKAGVVKLVGDDADDIIQSAGRLLDDRDFYRYMARGISPYGDGKASERILNALAGLPFDEFKG